MKNIYIGIDPDEGWATWDADAQKLLAVDTVDFWTLDSRLREISKIHQAGEVAVRIYIETPQHNAPVFPKSNRPNERRKLLKIAQNVGENKGKAKLLVQLCKELFGNENVFEMTPNKKSLTKLDKAPFKLTTGWQPRTSEHGRDAAMLVFGR